MCPNNLNLKRTSFIVIVLLAAAGRAAGRADAQLCPPEHIGETTPLARTTTDTVVHLSTPQEFVPEWYDMFANMPKDWKRYGEITFTTSKIPGIIGMSALTAVLVATDDATWKASDKWYQSSSVVRSVSDAGVWIGHGVPQFGLAGAFALYGFAAHDSRALRTASQTTQAILACGVVVQVLKHITGRESPVVATQPGGVWRFFPNQIEYHKHVPHYDAFPSGHVATALTTVTVIAENYSEISWIRPVGYTLVGILAVSMANTGIHWYSDYPLGLALGYSFGMLAAHPEGWDVASAGSSDKVKFSLAPSVSSQGPGVQLVVLF
jgi:hypothetical protein